MKQLIAHLVTTAACIVWDYFLLKNIIYLINARDNWMWALLLMFIFIPKQPVTIIKKENGKIITDFNYNYKEEDEE